MFLLRLFSVACVLFSLSMSRAGNNHQGFAGSPKKMVFVKTPWGPQMEVNLPPLDISRFKFTPDDNVWGCVSWGYSYTDQMPPMIMGSELYDMTRIKLELSSFDQPLDYPTCAIGGWGVLHGLGLEFKHSAVPSYTIRFRFTEPDQVRMETEGVLEDQLGSVVEWY